MIVGFQSQALLDRAADGVCPRTSLGACGVFRDLRPNLNSSNRSVMFPQLAHFTDRSLLLLRLMFGLVFPHQAAKAI
jgi:hypothetical protein